jgi:chromate transport protein ChrA
MTEKRASAEFSTWVALAFGAIAIAVAAAYSSSLWVLFLAGLIGGGLGYWLERLAWRAIEKRMSRRRDP